MALHLLAEYASALHNMLSRSMAGVVDPGALATLLVCYAGLALAAVYISRTELRLPTMQYASIAATSEVCVCECTLQCLFGRNILCELYVPITCYTCKADACVFVYMCVCVCV